MKLKIKKEFESVVIGYNGSSAAIGGRNDLHKLYEIAKKSMPTWLDYFETISEDELLENKSLSYKEAKEVKEAQRLENTKT